MHRTDQVRFTFLSFEPFLKARIIVLKEKLGEFLCFCPSKDTSAQVTHTAQFL